MSGNGSARVGPHLSDEELSAALDERADDHAQAHLAACERCQMSLAAWRRAQAAWTVPPEPADSARVDAAIRVALSRAGSSGKWRRAGGRIVLTRPRRWMVPALAAVLAVVLGLALLARSNPPRPKATSAGASAATQHESKPPVAEHPTSARPEVPANAGGAGTPSLGAITSRAELRGVLRQRLAAAAQSTRTKPAEAGTCLLDARRAAKVGNAVVPTYQASLRYQGVAAQVAVFNRDGTRLGVVTADDGCGVLATLTL